MRRRTPSTSETGQRLPDNIQEFRSRLEFAVSARGWGYVLEGEGAVNKDDIDLVEKLINECRKDGVLPLNICALDAKREFSNVERIDDTTPEEEAEAAYDFCKSTAERILPFSFYELPGLLFPDDGREDRHQEAYSLLTRYAQSSASRSPTAVDGRT